MERQLLGRTGLEVTRIGLGGIKFGLIDQDVAIELVNVAIDRGINLVDTARGYPDSETRIGEALAGRRDQVILSSKSPVLAADEMRGDLEASLEALRTDFIDIYKIHNLRLPEDYDKATGPGGALEALEKARNEGLIGHIGISCHRYHDTLERAIQSGRFDVIMVAYNVLNDELMDEHIMPLAKSNNVGVLVMKPLAGGVLGAAPKSLKLQAGESKVGIISVKDAIRFVLANENVDCAVVGVTCVDELEEDVAAVDEAGRLSQEEISVMVEAAESFGRKFCRACGYCQPCPNGILIPIILRHLFYLKEYGLKTWAKGRYGMVEVKADNCTRCDECVERCPYDLPIPDLLEEAHERLS